MVFLLSIVGLGRAQVLPPAPEAPASFGTTVVRPFGLRGEIYLIKRGTERLPDFDKLEPVGVIYTSYLKVSPQNTFTLGFPGFERRKEWFAIDYKGRFYVDPPGKYAFALISDDGSKLYIDGRTVIDNDGQHSSTTETGSVTLTGGIHTIRVSYFQGPCMNRIDPCVELQLGVKPPGAPEFRYFTTEEFKPPSNPADWKYGDPSQLQDPPDPNAGRRKLRDTLKKAPK
jgi:hypothetical protein